VRERGDEQLRLLRSLTLSPAGNCDQRLELRLLRCGEARQALAECAGEDLEAAGCGAAAAQISCG